MEERRGGISLIISNFFFSKDIIMHVPHIWPSVLLAALFHLSLGDSWR